MKLNRIFVNLLLIVTLIFLIYVNIGLHVSGPNNLYVMTQNEMEQKIIEQVGETCEVSREAFRVLRAEEKRLRRSYTAAASDGDEAHPILSLNVLPEDSEKSPSWLTDHEDFTDEVLTKMVIQEFRATLNSIHCAVFDQCLLGDKTIRAFAEEYGLRRSTVWDIANSLRKNFKKIL